MPPPTTATAIQAALRSALPPALHSALPELASLLADVASGVLTPDQARVYLAGEPTLAELPRALVGQSFESDGVGLRFDGDVITINTIRDSETVAVGRGAIALKIIIDFSREELAYNVAQLPTNPFLGLRPFGYEDRVSYAGRDRIIATTVRRITELGKEYPLLFITGASGSGKSSLARAGLLPALEIHYAKLSYIPRLIDDIRPSQEPLSGLITALRKLGLPAENLTIADLAADHTLFASFLRDHTPPDQYNLLIIDQFEEVFTRSVSDQRDVFFSILTALPSVKGIHTHIIVTLRTDYLPDLFRYKFLYDLAVAEPRVDLRAMSVAELREAIRRPIQAVYSDNLIEPALVERLVMDAEAHETYLPLLQVTLEDLWRGGVLRLAAYRGLADSIQRRADQIWNSKKDANGQFVPRPAIERNLILSILLDLVEVSLDSDAHRDVRRSRVTADLSRGEPTRARLIDELVGERLLSKSLEQQGQVDVETVDIIHESLIDNWMQLRVAIATQREILQQRARFELALQDWLSYGRDTRYLLPNGIRLAEAEELEKAGSIALEGKDARNFLQQSVAQRDAERRLQLRRRNMIIAALMLLVLFLFVAVMLWQGSAEEAQQKASEAQSRLLSSEAQLALSRHESETALTLALSAIRIDPRLIESQFTLTNIASVNARRVFMSEQDFTDAVFGLDDLIIFSSNKNDIISWNITTGKEIQRIAHAQGDSTKIAVSPNGKKVAFVSNQSIQIWDVENSRKLYHLENSQGTQTNLSFSLDGSYLLSTSDQNVQLWEVATGQESYRFTDYRSPSTFVSNGQYILSNSIDNTVRLWQITKGQELQKYTVPDNLRQIKAFSSDGNLAISVLYQKNQFGDTTSSMLVLWDIKTGKEKRRFAEVNAEPTNVVFSPTGDIVASSYPDGSIYLWNVIIGEDLIREDIAAAMENKVDEIQRFYGHPSSVSSISFSSDGKSLLSSSKVLQLWDIAIGEESFRLTGHDHGVGSLAISPDGQIAVSASADVKVWDLQTKLETQHFTQYRHPVILGPSGKVALSDSTDNTLRLWNVQTGEELRRFEQYRPPMAFSPDGATVLSSSTDKSLRLWNVQTGQEFNRFHTDYEPVAFSKDLKFSLSGIDDTNVHLWNVATGQEVRRFHGHSGLISSMSFSPDNRFILSGSWDDTLRLWDVETGQELRRFDGHRDWVGSVVFDANGKNALSGAADGQLIFWSIRPILDVEQLIAWVCVNRDVIEPNSILRETYDIREQLCPSIAVLESARKLIINDSIDEASAQIEGELRERTFSSNPHSESKRFMVLLLVDYGRSLARSGNVQGAIIQFKHAIGLDPNLELDPEFDTRQLIAQALINKGLQLTRMNDIKSAVKQFQQARSLYPNIHSVFIAREVTLTAIAIARQGNTESAFALLLEADMLDPELRRIRISDNLRETICLIGALEGDAAQVSRICQPWLDSSMFRQDALSEESILVNTLLGLHLISEKDYIGAAENFKLLRRWMKQDGGYSDYMQQVDAWIVDLEAGQSPLNQVEMERIQRGVADILRKMVVTET